MAVFACAVAGAAPVLTQVVSQLPIPERQLPVFRGDAHFVRVDAYPTDKDGAVLRGLTADDFELTEDGVRQTIDSAQFVEYDRWSPGAEPPDPIDQRTSFRLAADPSYRVFAVYVDRISRQSAYYLRQPLIDTLTREIGPRDLFGLILSTQEASDIVLGRFTPSMQAQLTRFLQTLNHNDPFDMDPIEQQLLKCFGSGAGEMIGRWRTDNTYRDLEGLITILGTLRDERKSLIFITERMPGTNLRSSGGGTPSPTGGTRGTPPAARGLPGAGGLSAGIVTPNYDSAGACVMLGSSIPHTTIERYEALIDLARRMNVAINPVNPEGLTMRTNWSNGYLRQLADETGGIAIVNSNGIRNGLQRIKHDMPGYYMLGYYTSNTKWDGKMRTLKVKLKSTGDTIRARYEYQAPSAEDVAAMRAAAERPPIPTEPTDEELAMGVLSRLRRDAVLHIHGVRRGASLLVNVEVPPSDAAQWRSGGTVSVTATDAQGRSISGDATLAANARGAQVELLVGTADVGPWRIRAQLSNAATSLEDLSRVTDEATGPAAPLLFRAGPQAAAPFHPVADPQFWRNERARIEWWLPATIDPSTLKARLLQPSGQPLGYEPPVVTEATPQGLRARVDLRLTSVAAADYLVELSADGPESVRALQAIRVVR